ERPVAQRFEGEVRSHELREARRRALPIGIALRKHGAGHVVDPHVGPGWNRRRRGHAETRRPAKPCNQHEKGRRAPDPPASAPRPEARARQGPTTSRGSATPERRRPSLARSYSVTSWNGPTRTRCRASLPSDTTKTLSKPLSRRRSTSFVALPASENAPTWMK